MASEASQAVVLPTTKLASLTAIFPISPLFSAFFPHYRACMVPGYQPQYTLLSSPKLWTQLVTLLSIYFNLLRTCSIKKLGPKKWMLSTLCLLFNRTELVEGLSVGTNFYPQPHSMSDYNVLPVF